MAMHSDTVQAAVQTPIPGLGAQDTSPASSGSNSSSSFCYTSWSLSHFPKLTGRGCQARWVKGETNCSCHCPFSPRNATNLAFRLFAPFIRMPLRNLRRVSVHSFSLMKHQISLTNNSCVTTRQPGPSQRGCNLRHMQRTLQVCSSQNSDSSQSPHGVAPVTAVTRDTVQHPQHLPQYLRM